jgi:hypothetical protein
MIDLRSYDSKYVEALTQDLHNHLAPAWGLHCPRQPQSRLARASPSRSNAKPSSSAI